METATLASGGVSLGSDDPSVASFAAEGDVALALSCPSRLCKLSHSARCGWRPRATTDVPGIPAFVHGATRSSSSVRLQAFLHSASQSGGQEPTRWTRCRPMMIAQRTAWCGRAGRADATGRRRCMPRGRRASQKNNKVNCAQSCLRECDYQDGATGSVPSAKPAAAVGKADHEQALRTPYARGGISAVLFSRRQILAACTS